MSTHRREPITLEASYVTQEILSAREFLELSRRRPGLIKSSRAIIARPGRKGFGKFVVQYTHPKLKVSA